MTTRNNMGSIAWSYYSETVAQYPDGMFSVGVGQDLMDSARLSKEDAAEILGPTVHILEDGGACALRLKMPDICEIKVYARKRGKAVDFGTRRDFTDVGWEKICHILDSNLDETTA